MQATRLFTVLLVSLLFSATAGSLTAQTITHVPLYTFHGDSESLFENFGYSVSGAGDVNGDGLADVIVGVAANDNFRGSARVLSGNDGSVLYNLDGDTSSSILGDQFGFSVSGAGDVNGDGIDDFIVGAPNDDNNGAESGNARVLSGSDGSILYDFDGDSAGDLFGRSVSAGGDVNGDGFDDFIVGARGDDNNGTSSGSARVLSGIDGSVLYNFDGDSAGDLLGTSVSGAGDVNGDGRADLIVGAFSDDNNGTSSGSARVLSGIDGSVLYNFDGDSAGDLFGQSVSAAGDVNGDGMADLIVGANGNNDFRGSARVLSGSDGSVLYTFDGDNAFDHFGSSVSGAGDVNGDGRADLIVGSPNANNFRGNARVLSGSDGSVLYNLDGDNEGDSFGLSVSGAGDVNGDGIDDFIIGAPFEEANYSGYARVFVSQISAPACLLGDVDLSGTVDFLDIQPLIQNLCCGSFQCEADCDQSGMVDFLDIQPFIAILSSQ